MYSRYINDPRTVPWGTSDKDLCKIIIICNNTLLARITGTDLLEIYGAKF